MHPGVEVGADAAETGTSHLVRLQQTFHVCVVEAKRGGGGTGRGDFKAEGRDGAAAEKGLNELNNEEENVDWERRRREHRRFEAHVTIYHIERVINLRVFVEAEAIGCGWKTFESKIAIRCIVCVCGVCARLCKPHKPHLPRRSFRVSSSACRAPGLWRSSQ